MESSRSTRAVAVEVPPGIHRLAYAPGTAAVWRIKLYRCTYGMQTQTTEAGFGEATQHGPGDTQPMVPYRIELHMKAGINVFSLRKR